MFIQTETTPNEHALKFKPGRRVLADGAPSVEITNFTDSKQSPLARSLFAIAGVRGVFFGHYFITVNKSEDSEWAVMKPEIYGVLMDFFTKHAATTSGDDDAPPPPIFFDSESKRKVVLDEDVDVDPEILLMIKELLDTRIRPAVQEDGGDIEYRGFKNGTVKLLLKGSCRGCGSSEVTLKNGIENMMKFYIPEVKTVEQVLDEADLVSKEAFDKLEKELGEK